MNLTKEIVELFINLRNDYGLYLTHIGVQDTPVPVAVHDGYFNSHGGKTIVTMEPTRGPIFTEIKYQLNELDKLFGGNYIEINQVKKIRLNNNSYFISVREPIDLKGRGYSHLLVLDGFQNKKYFDEIVCRPATAAYNTKVSIIPK